MADSDITSRQWVTYRRALLPLLGDLCHLCGKPVDKTLPGTHPRGPTIDHIVPRSQGGNLYARNNLALAHQACNSAKRDRQPTRHSRNW